MPSAAAGSSFAEAEAVAGLTSDSSMANGRIPPEVLRERRAALLARIPPGIAVIRGADERTGHEHPQASSFRQDDDFYYLTGIEIPGSWLVMFNREGAADSVVLFVPARDPSVEAWRGPQAGAGEEVARRTGVSVVQPTSKLEEFLVRLSRADELAELGTLHLLKDARSRELAQLAEAAGRSVNDMSAALAELRLVKDSVELERLRRAIDITVEAHGEAMKAARPGMYEYELEAVLEYVLRSRGAERLGFPSIVGSGPNSVVLHHDTNRRRMEKGDVVVVDIGAEYGYYTADLTRTFPVSGEFTRRQREVYELVLATQETVLESVRPGVTLGQLTRIARDYMREHSKDLCGDLTCDKYFIHGLSHWLGLDVHDVGRVTTPLAPGMVLTVEPGIYLPDEQLGVRIEDDVLVTEDGHELLSAQLPRSVEEIEALMREPSRLAPVNRNGL